MRKIQLSLTTLLLLFAIALPALADLGGQELELTSAGIAYEINPDPQGILWLSDYGSGEVWRIDPVTGAASVYSVGGNPSDARHDGAGSLWWGDAASGQVGRVSTSGEVAQLWQIPGSAGLFGSGLASDGSLWVTDIENSLLHNISPGTNKICSYTLPDDMLSDYLAVSGDFVWLGDVINGRIARLQISNGNFTTWDIGSGSFPEGLVVDALGNPWWADSATGELGSLTSDTTVITYTQSLVQYPSMLSIGDGLVWFTDGTNIGFLNPAVAVETTTPVQPQSHGKLHPTCPTILPTPSAPVTISTPEVPWTAAIYPLLLDQDGWQVFEIDSTSFTWGIAALEEIWVVDQGRQVLARVSLSAPSIDVYKTPNRMSVPETGADVTFTFGVTNTSFKTPVTITSLEDSVFGPLEGDDDCQVGAVLAVGAGCEFEITRWVAGDYGGPPHTNTFTSHAENSDQVDAFAEFTASPVSFTSVLPAIAVTKTANPTTVPETGADVVFTFTVKNNSLGEVVTITSLEDSVFGVLEGDEDCQVGTLLAAGSSCEFAITRHIAVPVGGPSHYNVFTAHAKDDDNSTATAMEGEAVAYAPILPAITVTKAANPTLVPESGGNVEFTFTVQNSGPVDVTISSLSDNNYGALTGSDTCKVGTPLAVGQGCQFSITRLVKGDYGSPHINVFTAQAEDSAEHLASDTDDAQVDFSNVLPTLAALKTPSLDSVPASGAEVTFTFRVTNTSLEPVTITSLEDSIFGTLTGDAGCQVNTLLAPGAHCEFSITEWVKKEAAPSHVNVFSVHAVDNEQSDASATDDATVTFTSGPVMHYVYLPMVRR